MQTKMVSELYAIETQIREGKLKGKKKQEYRLLHAKPAVERVFAWIDQQFERQGLLPKNPLTVALAYAREHKAALMVLPGRPRGTDRHQSSGAHPVPDPDGAKKLAILLDRAGGKSHRYRAKPDCDLSSARH
jgi:hypothetical protein